MVKEAAMRAIEILHPRDQLGILTFNHAQEWTVPLGVLGQDITVRQALDSVGGVRAVGGTNLLDPLRLGIEALQAQRFGQQHIVLLTDGISGVGTRPEYQALVEQAIDANITVSSIAVGTDADTELLALIAEWGQGRFRLALRPADIPRMIVAETQYAASELIQRGLIQPQIAMPHPLVSNFAAADFPPLAGHVGVQPRPVSEADTVLVTPLGDPLLAAWQYGLGRVVAWTSDAAREWSPAYAEWSQLDRFWTQLVRYALPDPSLGPLLAQAEVRGSQVDVTVLASGADGRGINLADGELSFVGPDGESAGVALPQTAPGEYAAGFQLPLPGAYRGLVSLAKEGQRWEVPLGFVVGYSPEYSPRLSSGLAVLEQIAALTGGRVLASPLDAELASTDSAEADTVSYAPWLLLAAALAWPLEIALRRRWRPWR
jgi:hypothetical protein